MAKHRRRHRRNPTGTLLVNPSRKRRGSSSKKSKRSRKSVSIASLLSRAVSNPRKRRAKRSRGHRRNPLIVNPRRRRSSKRSRGHRRNPLIVNPRKRRSKSRRSRRNPLMINRGGRRRSRRNPLLVNPRKRRSKGRRSRRNPLLVNPRGRRGKGRRRNPSSIAKMGSGLLGKAKGYARKLPLVGGILSTALGGIGATLAGAVAVIPTELVMPYIAKYIPDWFKPYAYSAAGLILSGVVTALPFKFPFKRELAVGLTFAGGAIDMHRYRHGTSMTLAGADYGEDPSDYAGEDGLGNDGGAFAAVEYADSDLQDANYCGEDLSMEEIGAAELGRMAFRKRFPPRYPAGQEGCSSHAGLPGERWGWLIYWVGFENFQRIAALPETERRKVIRDARHAAMQNTQKMLGQGMTDTSVVQAETAGLLIAG
jgi:hypothetical protein